LKKEGYSEEQIGPWVRRTPIEKTRKPRNKSSPENLTENRLRTGEKIENENFSDETLTEKTENEKLRIPEPEGNKGTQSTGDVLGSQSSVLGSQSSVLDDSHSSVLGSHQFSVRTLGENNFSPDSRKVSLENLSPEQFSSLGMMRDGKGAYFHVTNTEDGGYHLSLATQESIAGAVAGVQRQAQRAQQAQ
jgi:hypothetical protein